MKNYNQLKLAIDSYEDFPQEGIVFRDVLPILRNPEIFSDITLSGKTDAWADNPNNNPVLS